MGARPPKSLHEENIWNPKGYWESEKIKVFNDRLLDHVGSSWWDWSALKAGWEEELFDSLFSDELLVTVDAEFGNADLLVVKDPRICRLVPFWVANLRRMEIEPLAILPLRNPLEVADSLSRRDNLLTANSLLLWLRHSLDAEFATRGMPRSFQRYDDLLNDWRGVVGRVARDLNFDWPDWSIETERQIDDFIAVDLRHHRSSHEKLAQSELVAGWVERTYGYLSALADGAEDSEVIRHGLDIVREEFDRISPIFRSISKFYERQEEVHRQEVKKLEELVSSQILELGSARAHQLDLYRHLCLQKAVADNEITRREKSEGTLHKYRFVIKMMENVGRARRQITNSISWNVFLSWREHDTRDLLSELDTNTLIREAGLFDDGWYITKYPDVLVAGMEPLTHYLQIGVHEGRNPNPYFDTAWYLRKYPDVAEAGVNPLFHFAKMGAMEERDPGPDFSTLGYLIQHPELVLSQKNPLGHFLMHRKG